MVPELLRDSLQVVREFNTPTADDLVELQKALVPQFENVLQKYIQGSVMSSVYLYIRILFMNINNFPRYLEGPIVGLMSCVIDTITKHKIVSAHYVYFLVQDRHHYLGWMKSLLQSNERLLLQKTFVTKVKCW